MFQNFNLMSLDSGFNSDVYQPSRSSLGLDKSAINSETRTWSLKKLRATVLGNLRHFLSLSSVSTARAIFLLTSREHAVSGFASHKNAL